MSSISKKDGRLEGYAKDPISSGLSFEAFIPKDYWKKYGGEVFIMGAGGSAIAMSSYLLNKNKGDNVPSKLIIGNRSKPRLDEIQKIVKEIAPVPAEFYLTPETTQNDLILKNLKPHSVIVNATGLGKDRPGSPLSDACEFPRDSLVWEINYRGDLLFMHQALKQMEAKNLHIEDGWIYFVHGWTQVISEIFHVEITGTVFRECEKIANDLRGGNLNE
ncbi:MAG TPA: shikimate dehydrogenase [Ruminiclostridium sp.]